MSFDKLADYVLLSYLSTKIIMIGEFGNYL